MRIEPAQSLGLNLTIGGWPGHTKGQTRVNGPTRRKGVDANAINPPPRLLPDRSNRTAAIGAAELPPKR